MNRIKSLYRRPKEWVAKSWSRTHTVVRHTLAFTKKWLLWPTAVIVILACVWGLIEYWDSLPLFWDWLRTTGDSTESGSTTIRNIGFIIAGSIALPLAIWRSMVAQKQADIAQQSLLNERYQQGAEMLGSEVLSVRLGGIYALRSLAEEHPEQYHIQAMRLLCAFVRNPTKDEVVQSEANESDENPTLREDVQVAIDTICACHEVNSRLDSITQFWLDFRGADLRGAHLRSVNLSVKLSLIGQTFAEFINSHQRGADFEGARLHSANIEFATLSGANFSNAKLIGTHLDAANLSQARFRDAKLCDAWLVKTDLSGSELRNANLSGAKLWGANLSGAKFVDPDSEILPGPVQGLTQSQLDDAVAYPDNLPILCGVLDAETGKQLKWRGGVPDDE